MSAQTPVHVNISSLTIVKVLLVTLGLLFVWAVRDIIAMVFVAWVLASALAPWVDRLQRWHIPRALGILSVYVAAGAVITVVIVLLVPPVSSELSSIAHNFPAYYEPIRDNLNSLRATGEEIGLLNSIQQALDNTVRNVVNLTSGLYEAVASLFGGLITAIGILVIAFYMTIEEDGIKSFIRSVTPASYQPYVIHKLTQIQKRLSSWLWGQLLLMCFIGTLTGVALWILGVPYALVLGILAGMLEFIPIIGPTVAAIPAVFFAFSDYLEAPYKPFIVIIMFIVIQQVENQLLVPRVMKRAVGLNPIVVIIALLVGVKLGGFIGLVLAVPFVAILDVFVSDFIADKQREQNRLEA